MNSAIAYQTGPIAFLSLSNASDTGCGCTARLIRDLGRVTGVVTIDVGGNGSESSRMKHLARNLHHTGFSSLALFPEQPYMTAFNGTFELPRLVRETLPISTIGEAVSRLRRAVHDIGPRAVCLDDERALFIAWLAMPPDLPLVYLVTSDLNSIRSDCAPAWCRVNAALGVSEYSLRYLSLTHYAHRNLHVVGSGIDVDRLLARVEAQTDGEPLAGRSLSEPAQVGRPAALSVMSPISFPRLLKGHRVGMQAIAGLNRMGVPAELWLCGLEGEDARSSGAGVSGPSGRALRGEPSGEPSGQSLAAELRVQEHVRVLGRRSNQPSAVARSDVALFLSSVPQTHQSILEAMALAKPVVAARTGSAPELVRDGVDGILVEPDDVQATVTALQRLSDPALRERMGSSGRRRVRQEFSPGRQADRFLRAIESLGEPRWLTRDWTFHTSSL